MCLFGIRMINVGFGDCFLLHSNEKAYLMVDCGTDGKWENGSDFASFEACVDSLQNELETKLHPCSALITHFHEDHCKGFRRMAENFRDCHLDCYHGGLFDTVYVPYMLMKNSAQEYCMMEMAVVSYLLLPPADLIFLMSDNILNQMWFTSVLSKNANVVFLANPGDNDVSSCKDEFVMGAQNFQVVWPDVCNFPVFDQVPTLRDINEKVFPGSLRTLMQEIVDVFQAWYELCMNPRDEQDPPHVDREHELKGLIHRQYENMRRLKAMKKEMEAGLSKEEKKKLRAKWKRLQPSDNMISIVFHNETDVDGVLMTGDITKDLLEDVLVKEGRLRLSYDVIKAPHHGTKVHYSYKLPKVRHFLCIPNGDNGQATWGICEAYRTHENADVTRICSAGETHCESFKKGVLCKNSMCRADEKEFYCIIGGV